MGGVKGDEVLLSSPRAGAPEGGFFVFAWIKVRVQCAYRHFFSFSGVSTTKRGQPQAGHCPAFPSRIHRPPNGACNYNRYVQF